jgi:peptidoglycan/LPS O-acetylase OafA/YrhL
MLKWEIVGIIAGSLAIGLSILTAQFLTRFSGFTFNPDKRLGYIDGLRGLLALGVFLHHYMVTYYSHVTGEWTNPPSQFYTMIARVAIALFFIITGFLFWHRLLIYRGRVNWAQLYVSRVFRLVPLHWFAVIMLLAIVSYASAFIMKVHVASFLAQIFQWLFLTEMPYINAFSDTVYIGGVLWTLRYEWLFYLTLFFFGFAVRFAQKCKWLLWLMAAITLVTAKLNFNIPYLKISTAYLLFFLVGAICAAAYQKEICRAWARKGAATLISLLAIIFLFVLFKDVYGIKAGALMMLFFFPIASGNPSFNFLKKPAFLLLGEISYSIYLLHGFLLYIMFWGCFPRFMTHSLSPFALWAAMAATAVLLVLVAYLTFSLIESPFINLGRKISQHLAISPPGHRIGIFR